MTRRWAARMAGNLALSLGSVVVVSAALVGAELLDRRLSPDTALRLGLSEADLYIHSARYGWELRPGFRGPVAGALTTINALGYRGSAPGPRSPARTRVVVLGDSVAFGYGVADGLPYPAVLERSEPALEVLDLAVPGHGTDQQLLRLQHDGFALRPEVVILGFCLANDVGDNARCHASGRPKPCFRLELGALRQHNAPLALSPPARLALFLRERSLLYNRLLALWPSSPGPSPETSAPADDVELTTALVCRMRDEAHARGARFLLVLHPGLDDFRAAPPRATRKLTKAMAAAGVDALDLREGYAREGLGLDRYHELALDMTGHLTPRGHTLTARLVAEKLRTLGWMPADGGPVK